MKILCVFIVGLSICGAGIIKRYIFIINASLPFFLFAFTCVNFYEFYYWCLCCIYLVDLFFIYIQVQTRIIGPSPPPTSFDIARTFLKVNTFLTE